MLHGGDHSGDNRRMALAAQAFAEARNIVDLISDDAAKAPI